MGERLLIGAMSGTSADGVDAALVRISGQGLQMRATLAGFVEHAFPIDFRTRIQAIRSASSIGLGDFCDLGLRLSEQYAAAVRRLLEKTDTTPEQVTAIAAHGQTLFHAPPLTLQWIDPAWLAQKCRIDVVSDFRRADCAVGGQGAPLVPFADYLLFRSETENRVILNIGGIANVTILPAGCSIDQVIGFDTGPGNCVVDHLCRKFFPDGPGYDAGGSIAASAIPDLEVLRELMTDEYFNQPPPKSTDTPAMIQIFEQSAKAMSLAPAQQIATATSWTAESIRHSIRPFTPEIIVAGGGTRNGHLMSLLKQQGARLRFTDDFGIPTQAREAIAFAILGAATLDRTPANVLSVTGASRAVVLGAITPFRMDS